MSISLPDEVRIWICYALGASEVVSHELIQPLWGGCGTLGRVSLSGCSVPSAILKLSHPPPAGGRHPRGWQTELSSARKVRSYEIEATFYSEWSRKCPEGARIASCFAFRKFAGGRALLLEDLDASGFPARRRSPSHDEMNLCLRWLAAFHAAFMGARPEGLWPVGCYWHLATRPDELAALPENSELRRAAAPLDRALNTSRFKTLIHGDAKLANFCFASSSVAGVDFQYVGGGCGIRDVVYFLSSCFEEDDMAQHATPALEVYFKELRSRVRSDIDAAALEAEWRELYPVAWADFHRFLAGWAPGHWKIHEYTKSMTRIALRHLGV